MNDLTLIPPFAPPLARTAGDGMFQEGGLFEGHDRPVWGDLIPLYGPL